MKFILFLLLALMTVQAHAFRVLWWNTGGGNFLENPASSTYDNDSLEMSLKNLVNEKSPDMVVLGEYFDGLISSQTHERLLKTHPYYQSFRYNSKRRMEIIVFSKVAFSYSYNQSFLTWKKKITTSDEKKDYYYRRSFQRLQVKDGDRELNLVPLHTMMPWTEMATNNSGLSRINSTLGKAEVAWEILFSADNKLGYQAQQFKHLLASAMATSPDAVWASFGDFNVPSSYAGIETEIFKVLRGPLTKGKRLGDNTYSFPYPRTQTTKKFAIDHVVSNTDDLTYRYLKYPGSDHFPMLFDL
jgi:hypothetical protein